jgi:uncharacterized protein
MAGIQNSYHRSGNRLTGEPRPMNYSPGHARPDPLEQLIGAKDQQELTMPDEPGSSRPWLIAAWPGMGNVAIIAAGYLIRELDMQEMDDLPSRDHFDISEVEVRGGVIVEPHLPRGVFFRRPAPVVGRDLIIFLGEAQPSSGAYAYAHELLQTAISMGVERVITFASMASALHPAENPRVFGVATNQEILTELRHAEVEPLGDGQIGGLNGVLLAAAAERDVAGMCLLAEIPFFAAAVPNPKAARAALSVFTVLTGIDVSLAELGKHAVAVDRALIEALEKLQTEREGQEPAEEAAQAEPEEAPEGEPAAPPPEAPREPDAKLDYPARRRIEELFEAARKDQRKAMSLKQELDRLGVFRQYEDRFLDLFRRAE